MIVRAGGLTLTAPDTVPDAARGPLDHIHQQARNGLGVTDEQLHALEVAAFGTRHAGRLRRSGPGARASALGQLVRGWGEDRLRLSPLARGAVSCR